jgi:hypothetical protein
MVQYHIKIQILGLKTSPYCYCLRLKKEIEVIFYFIGAPLAAGQEFPKALYVLRMAVMSYPSHCVFTEIPTEMAFIVDDLLSTNSTPSQEQRNNLQNVILQLDEAISDINEQILALQAKILVLQISRTRLVQQWRCYSSLLSPVRCLPIENFGQIFVYATRDRPRHVLNLSAVYQLWRYAALSTPTLWSTLELGHRTARWNMRNHIDSWIERAHSYPLSLPVVIRKQDSDDFFESCLHRSYPYRQPSVEIDYS